MLILVFKCNLTCILLNFSGLSKTLGVRIWQGTAEVVYSRRIDGIAALKRYNNVQLDGKAMKIEFIGSNLVTPANMPSTTTTMASQSASTLQLYEGHDLIGLAKQAPNRAFGMGYVAS